MLNDCGNCENNNGPCQDHMALIIADHEKSKADARALWAYRATVQLLKHARVNTGWLFLADEKMLEEARRLLRELPEAVRRELGECPT